MPWPGRPVPVPGSWLQPSPAWLLLLFGQWPISWKVCFSFYLSVCDSAFQISIINLRNKKKIIEISQEKPGASHCIFVHTHFYGTALSDFVDFPSNRACCCYLLVILHSTRYAVFFTLHPLGDTWAQCIPSLSMLTLTIWFRCGQPEISTENLSFVMRTISWEAGYSVLHHTFYLLNSIYKYGFMDFSLFTRNVKHTHTSEFS